MIPGGLSPAGSVALGMGAPGTSPTVNGPQDPRSAYLAAALQSLQQAQPQTPGAVGSDLLAEALMQYGRGGFGGAPNASGGTPAAPMIPNG